MRYAIFSDIHNHTQALQQVLADAATRSVDQYYCLGDVGVDDCLDLVQAAGAPTVFGNWEVAHWPGLRPENQTWVLQLPPMIRLEHFWLTHAGPFWPDKIKTLADLQNNRHLRVKGGMFPYLHFEENSLWEALAVLAEADILLMFHGHTHRQMGWRFTRSSKLQRVVEKLIKLRSDSTYVIGVGSVGNPQDGPGASYAIYDDVAGTVEMLRLPPQ